jgi:2'-5' RNA ligase
MPPPFIKVFFALWPTAEERSQLSAWQTPLKHLCGGRAMRRDTLHNTLVFIGNVVQSRLESLQLTALEFSAETFELCFDEARYWGHNHIVYAAPAHASQHLEQLVGVLERGLTRHGFEFEAREYKPHVTLLRNAHWTDTHLPKMPPVCWQIQEFTLIKSVQQNGLSDYQVLARFPLVPSSG